MQIFDTDVFLICRSKQEGIPNLCVGIFTATTVLHNMADVFNKCIFQSYHVTIV